VCVCGAVSRAWEWIGAVMGQLVVHEFVTADGFAASVANTFEFHDQVEGGWDEPDARSLPWVEAASAVVLGARTYREFVEFWPTPASDAEILAPIINVIPKFVFSSSLPAAEWGDFAPATVESGDAIDAIRRIKRDSPGDVIVWGSLSLVHSFFAAGEVDVLRLGVIPVLLGDGRGVFPPGGLPRRLRARETTAFANGLVELQYDVVR
jgi:dihydrofolate reductase